MCASWKASIGFSAAIKRVDTGGHAARRKGVRVGVGDCVVAGVDSGRGIPRYYSRSVFPQLDGETVFPRASLSARGRICKTMGRARQLSALGRSGNFILGFCETLYSPECIPNIGAANRERVLSMVGSAPETYLRRYGRTVKKIYRFDL
jgi:hypothetical protein